MSSIATVETSIAGNDQAPQSPGEQPDACPVCQASTEPFRQVDGFTYRRCTTCRHQFLDYQPADSHVTDHYGDEYFGGSGDGYPDYLADEKLLVARGAKYARRMKRVTGRATGKLLDVGSAAGFISKGFKDSGWDVQGLEPSATMARHANGSTGVPTTPGPLESFATTERFDLVLLVQVIAHFEDPAAALQKIRTLLQPGGHLLIETWDCDSFTARLLRSAWHEYNPPSVLHAFSKSSLLKLAARCGFRHVTCKRTTKKLSGAHAKSALTHKYGSSRLFSSLLKPAVSLVPDTAPIPHLADDLLWVCLTPL